MAIYPNVLAGQDISADLLNSMLPKVAYKGSTTSRASTTTATADPDLLFAINANDLGTYLLEGFISYTGAAIGSGGLKIGFSYSGTISSGTWMGQGNDTTSTSNYSGQGTGFGGTTVNFGTNGGNFSVVTFNGSFIATTSGTLSIIWAQVASNATATSLRLNSWLKLTRIA